MSQQVTEVRRATFTNNSVTLLPPSLYEDAVVGLCQVIMKVQNPDGASTTGENTGIKSHPYCFEKVKQLQLVNAHHSTCLQNKQATTVLLGIEGAPEGEGSKAEKILDPKCAVSFLDCLGQTCLDFWEVGTGYLEVVRQGKGMPSDEITGLHWIPAECCYLNVYDEKGRFYYKVRGGSGSEKNLAFFGRSKDLPLNTFQPDGNFYSEVIEFKKPTNQNRWYGHASWLAALACIDLVQAVQQFSYDFFLNRGVPEFMLFITGGKLNDDEWAAVEKSLQDNIGLGKSHKSLALNIPNPDITITVEKMAMDSKGGKDEFDKKESCTMDIVSAHQTPPLLAGILIPGKLGATNELPNALAAYQALVIGPAQQTFQRVLGCTLGNSVFNGGLGLVRKDFTFTKITDELNLQAMDTSSRMQEPEIGSNRDLNAGLLD